MNTLKVLETAINEGLGNNNLDFFTEDKKVSFREYLGDIIANGANNVDDTIKAGLFIWGEENFISIPDTVFDFVVPDTDGTKVAYYKL